jgi:hypothetical protein
LEIRGQTFTENPVSQPLDSLVVQAFRQERPDRRQNGETRRRSARGLL